MRSFPNRIFLDRDMVSRLIKMEFGDNIQLCQAWADRQEQDLPAFPAPRSKAAIERWLRDGVVVKVTPDEGPETTTDLNLFALCALLDVDAFNVLDLEKIGFIGQFSYLRQLIYRGYRALGGLAPLMQMYGPNDVWPSDKMALPTYGHQWFRWNFNNAENYSSDDYCRVTLQFDRPMPAGGFAAHVAYRRLNSNDTMWRFYGSVSHFGNTIRKVTESGEVEVLHTDTSENLEFQTYFGGRPVEWQIASIHQFQGIHTIDNTDGSTVKFRW